jgi:hypothetical protein
MERPTWSHGIRARYTNPNYRPLLPHEERAWKARFEPQVYEYKNIFATPMETQERPVVINVTAGGILLLTLLELLNCLSNPEASGIEGQENTNAPESSPPSENSEA